MHFKWISSALDLLARWIQSAWRCVVCGVLYVCAMHLTYMLVCLFLQTWLWWSKSWVFLSSLSWDLQSLLRSLWILGQRHLHRPDQPHLLIHPQQPGVVQVCWEDCQLGHCSGVPTWRLLHKDCLQVLALQVSKAPLLLITSLHVWRTGQGREGITTDQCGENSVFLCKVAAELSTCTCMCVYMYVYVCVHVCPFLVHTTPNHRWTQSHTIS